MPVVDGESAECDEWAPLKCPINSNIYPGARFTGYQKSKSTSYTVEVQIDYIDWNQSYICGCINIRRRFLAPNFCTKFDPKIIFSNASIRLFLIID